MDTEKFAVQIGKSPLLANYASLVAWIIPIVEIIVAFFLVVKPLRIVGLYAAFTLMIAFTAYIIAILSFAQHIPCSCGGILEKMGWTEHLIFNIAFVLLGFLGIFLSTKRDSDASVRFN